MNIIWPELVSSFVHADSEARIGNMYECLIIYCGSTKIGYTE